MINVYSNLMSAWPATMAMSPKLNHGSLAAANRGVAEYELSE